MQNRKDRSGGCWYPVGLEGRPIEKKSQVITPTITPESELEWTFEFV